jgi:hypothetical protein
MNNPNSITREEIFKYGPIEPAYELIEGGRSDGIPNFRLDNDELLFKSQPNEGLPSQVPTNNNKRESSQQPTHTTDVIFEKSYNTGDVITDIPKNTINLQKTKHETSTLWKTPVFQSDNTREQYRAHKVELDKIINSCTLLYNDMSKLYSIQKRNQQTQMAENKKIRLFKVYAYVAVFSGLSFFLDNMWN